MSPTHMCRAQCGRWVHLTHSGAVLAPTPPQAAPGASALPAACPGSRFNPSQGPAALPSIPSIVSSDLELAGRCLLYPSPSSSSALSPVSSVFSGSFPQRCTGDRALACRGRGGFSSDGANQAESPCQPWSPPHPHPSTAGPGGHSASRVFSRSGFSNLFLGSRELPGGNGSCQGSPVPARARFSRTHTPPCSQQPWPL